MNNNELITKIKDIANFVANGKVVIDKRTFNGHPAFYLVHSKHEFNNELKSVIIKKEKYDRYDLFYYTNYMFKFMLNKYDSHTKILFLDNKYLPIKIRFFDGEPYIVDSVKNIEYIKGAKILKINGINIEDVIKELDKIICYSSYDFLKVKLEDWMININIIMSLPIMRRTHNATFLTDKGEIEFNPENLEEYKDKSIKSNYSLDVVDKTAIITYNSCNDEEKMINLINKLRKTNNIINYVVDLRGNGGGNSSINRHLIEFLKGKKIVALCDERVFSSARMCLIDLKNIGARIVGTNPGTPISCFGNCVMQQKLENMNLKVLGSATYWYYDENLQCHGIYKENFEDAIKQFPHLFDQVYFKVDDNVELTLEDYLNGDDSVLEYALSCFDK